MTQHHLPAGIRDIQAQMKDVAAKDAAKPPDLIRCMTGLTTYQKRWQEVAKTLSVRHNSNASGDSSSR